MRLQFIRILLLACVALNIQQFPADGSDAKSPGRGIAVDQFLAKLKFDRVENPLVSLLELSRQSQATFAKIHTWKGRVNFEDKEVKRDEPLGVDIGCFGMARGSYQLPLVRRTEGSGRFEFDVETDRYFSELMVERVSVIEIGTDKEVLTQVRLSKEVTGLGQSPVKWAPDIGAKVDSRYKLNLLFWKRSVVTPSEHLSLEPAEQYSRFSVASDVGPVFGRAAFKDEPKSAVEQQLSTVLRPASFFFAWSNVPIWDQLEELATKFQQALETGEISKESLAKRIIVNHAKDDFGHVYRLQIYFGDGEDRNSWTEYSAYFHENVGYLPLLADVRTGAGEVRTTLYWDYEVQRHLILPKVMARLIAGADPQYLSFQRKLEVVESEVNVPISEDRFTLAALELKDGERLLDRIENKLFVLNNGQLESATAPHSPNSPNVLLKPHSANGWLWIVVLNVAMIAGMVFFIQLRRRRGGPT